MSETPPPPEATPSQDGLGLFANSRFVRYSYAKFLSLLGQNALIYGLFIAVISDQESSVVTSAFVLASVVPSILLSLPGGLVADLLPRKLVLLIALALRTLVVYWFISFDPSGGAVIGLTFLVWTAYQFFSPAESAALLAIVTRDRLAHATSFLQGLTLVAQLFGAGLVAPLAVKLLDEDGLYVIVLVCFGLRARSLALAGFVCFAAVLLALPFVDTFAPEIAGEFGPIEDLTNWLKLSDPIVATIFLLPVAGLGSSFVGVAARTEVYRRVPSNLVAQVFATQSAMGSVGALVPTFLVGVLLDVLPVRAVMIVIGFGLTAIALVAWHRGSRPVARRPVPDTKMEPDAPDPGDEDWT